MATLDRPKLLLGGAVALGGSCALWVWYVRRTALQLHGPDQKRKRALGRERFHSKAVPANIDVIVIGSGSAGLSCASCLAQLGRRVLVLEQHEVVGGGLHAFCVEGKTQWEFDSGLHYAVPYCEQLLHVACGTKSSPIVFQKMGEQSDGAYDIIRLSDDTEDLRIKDVVQLSAELRRRFPSHVAKLNKFESICKALLKGFPVWVALHAVPWHSRWTLMRMLLPREWWEYADRTGEEVLLDIFGDSQDSVRLRSYLSSLWIDSGCPPHRMAFFMIAALHMGFPYEGGAYPVSGPQEMAFSLVEAIEARQGVVLTRAVVKGILVENGRAKGVQMADGTVIKAHEAVVAACGFRNMSQFLSGKNGHADPCVQEILDDARDLELAEGMGFVMANMGLNGSAEELGITLANVWTQPCNEKANVSVSEGVRRYLADPLGVPVEEIPTMITFPSIKGRDKNIKNTSNVETCQILCAADVKWFAKHAPSEEERAPAYKTNALRRDPEGYAALKAKWADRLKAILERQYPKTQGRIAFVDLSTPLSIDHFIPSGGAGTAIGLDLNGGKGCRFTDQVTQKKLDMKTKVQGLWLTGQDSLICGQPIVQAAGLLTAMRIAGPMGAWWLGMKSTTLLLSSFVLRT